MYAPVPVGKNTFWVGVNDRETDLFEGIWPIPKGISYNSYLVVADKTALIDTVKHCSADYLARIRSVIGQRPLDYLIVNHLEPDHSGAVRFMREAYPGLQIVGSKKMAEFSAHLYGISSGVRSVEDGEELDLGGRLLKFFLTPMVHWPETMMTYDLAERTLFSGDAFGGFAALDGWLFDDDADVGRLEEETLRYFSNIIGKYCPMVQKALSRLKGLDFRVIAPSHGPVWRREPARVVGWYDRWSRQETEEGLVIAFGSMYGNGRQMAEAVARGAAEAGLAAIRMHDVSRSHVSYIIRDAWRFRGIALGAPTYDTGLYPPTEHLLRLLERKTLRGRVAGVFGTCGWSGGGVKAVLEFVERASFELVEPTVEARFSPKAEDLSRCAQLGANLARRLRGSSS